MSLYSNVGQIDAASDPDPEPDWEQSQVFVCTSAAHDFIRLSVNDGADPSEAQAFLTVEQATEVIGHLQAAITRITKENNQ